MLFDARKLIKWRLPFLGEFNKLVHHSKFAKLVLGLSFVNRQERSFQQTPPRQPLQPKQGAPRGALFLFNPPEPYAAGGTGGAPGASFTT